MESYKRVFKVEVFSSSQNIDFPFYLKRFLELFSFSLFSIFFLPLSLSLPLFYAQSLGDFGVFLCILISSKGRSTI
jgi:hypothetical protein